MELLSMRLPDTDVQGQQRSALYPVYKELITLHLMISMKHMVIVCRGTSVGHIVSHGAAVSVTGSFRCSSLPAVITPHHLSVTDPDSNDFSLFVPPDREFLRIYPGVGGPPADEVMARRHI